jgi:small subunit ribosomal protein S1
MGKNLNKAELEKQKVLAFLDNEDDQVPENPGIYGTKAERGEFDSLFASSVQEQDFKVGDVVTGTVVEVQSDYVLVDINYKSEGLIAINEFRMLDGVRDVKAGDKVEVLIDRI